MIGLYKLECVRRDGPWRGVDDLELATLSWVHWFNQHRLHGALSYVPPIEHEQTYYRQNLCENDPSMTPQPHPRPGELTSH